MKILVLGKAPPLQGGVASRTFSFVRRLAELGHQVSYVTNADSAQSTYLEAFTEEDKKYFLSALSSVNFLSINSEVRIDHIPYSPSYETRLIGAAAASASQADLIVGWYYQPYGIAASILAKMFKKPYILVHAGSDLGRLSQKPLFQSAYKALFSDANFIAIQKQNADMIKSLFDIHESKIVLAERTRIVPSYFLSPPTEYSIADLISTTKDHIRSWHISEERKTWVIENNSKRPDKEKINLVIYGKTSQQKGHFELIKALANLVESGREFQFIACVGGHRKNVEHLIDEIRKEYKLSQNSFIVPFIPPWRVPSLIRMSDVVAFLERDFDISFHGPQVPSEVLWCGRALICSQEIAIKQHYAKDLINGENFYNAGDPKNIQELTNIISEAISDRAKLRTIGYRGQLLIRDRYGATSTEDGIVLALKKKGFLSP